MSKRKIWLIFLIGILILAACSGDGDDASDAAGNDSSQQLGPLDWNRDENTIILRVDERLNEGPPAQLANEIPPCTLWGDGRLVWVNYLQDENQVLEARLDDEMIRGIIEMVIFSGFYDWESNFAIPDIDNPLVRSITLNLFSEERTVLRYDDWPANGYERILAECRQASDTPALYLPEGAWISAYEVPIQDGIGHWRWTPQAAGFSLQEVANGQPPRWITGDVVKLIWTNTITATTRSRALDEDRAYEIALQVPNIMRDAPPAPQE